ncbi:MAG: PQQ-binding-like beta-propeller repeat protein [Planctomycetes bacterium]|nr:PQQ-binding-like beta-propeller repeat protein [Planctomycetota bacterium]
MRTLPRTARLGALVLLALGAAAPGLRAQQAEEDFRPYLLPQSDQATEQAIEAEKALTAGELERCAELLQKIIDTGEGRVVRRRALEPDAKDSSEHRRFEVYSGAITYAQGQLLEGPRALRRAYDKRFGAEARSRFERARDALDEAAAAEIVRRFAATDIGTTAARWIADRALERGDLARFEHYLALAARAAPEEERASESLEARRWIGQILQGEGPDPRASRDPRGAQGRDALSLGGREVPVAELEDRALRAREARRTLRAQDYPAVAVPTSERAAPSLGKLALQWEYELPKGGPFQYERRNGTLANLHPIVHQGTVLFTDSLRAYALDLYVGPAQPSDPELGQQCLWSSDWSEGMTEEEADEREGRNAETILAGAAEGGIFVVPLQVRISQPRQSFREFEITPPIPTRRLFAFEAATGRRLWSHWREELAGSEISERSAFLERAFVAGPPVIEGQRVLVPMYISEARFKYFVGCFDLRTGATLWVRYLLTGQKEMNMFGHIVEGFAASPVLVRDGAVYIVSNLGAVAALDLVDGEIRWLSTYPTLPLPAPAIQSREREKVWLNQPPALTRGVLFCTPVDSDFLCAYDAATGAPHVSGRSWRFPVPDERRINSLLYVDENRVLLGTSEGLAQIPHPQAEKRFGRRDLSEFGELGPESYLTKPRAAATADQLFLTDRIELFEFDLHSGGAPKNNAPIRSAYLGNCLIADGVLLAASNNSIAAFFDRSSVERAIFSRAQSGAPVDRLRLAQYLEREALRLYRAEDTRAGDDAVARAERALEADRELVPAATVLARLALLQAEQAELRGAIDVAEQKLDRALALVADGEMRWRTLVAKERLLREKAGYPSSYGACLALLEAEFGERAFSLPDGAQMRTAAYVAWRRYSQARSARDLGAQLAALSRILVEHPEELWEGDRGGERARATVAELLEIHGRDAYAPFEREAEALARSAAEKPAELELIAARYPNSLVAERLRFGLIDDASDLSRSTRAARLALESGGEEAAVLRRLASTSERAGGARRSQAIFRRLARAFPDASSELPADAGKRYAELAPPPERHSPAEPPPDEAKLERWDAVWGSDSHRAAIAVQGDDLAARGLLLLQRSRELEMHEVTAAAREPLRLLWRLEVSAYAPRPAPWHHRAIAVGERLVFVAHDRLLWIELRSGTVLREAPLPSGWKIGLAIEVTRPFCLLEDGVLVCLATAVLGGSGAQQLIGFDAETGALLWQRPSPVAVVTPMLAGAGQVALLGDLEMPEERASPRVPLALVDVQTGWVRQRLQLPAEIEPSPRHRAGLFVGELLVLRQLQRSPGLLALDTRSGRIAWASTSAALDEDGFSASRPWFLIHAAQQLYAALWTFDATSERERLALFAIDPSNGGVRRIALLGPGDIVQGLQSEVTVDLPRSELVVWQREGNPSAATPRCTLLDLAFGALRFSARQAAGIANAKLDESYAPRPPFACIDDRSFLLHLTTRQANGRTETLLRRFSARHGEPWSPPFPLPSDDLSSLTTVGGCYVAVGPGFLTVLRAAESSR